MGAHGHLFESPMTGDGDKIAETTFVHPLMSKGKNVRPFVLSGLSGSLEREIVSRLPKPITLFSCHSDHCSCGDCLTI